MSRISKQKALGLLQRLRNERAACDPFDSPSARWQRDARVNIEAIFGKESNHLAEIKDCSEDDELGELDEFGDFIDPCVSLLDSMIKEVSDLWSDDDGHVLSPESIQRDSRRVFLAHGHDCEVKQTVARFLEGEGLDVVILDERAGQGRTIIEKFEEHSSVGYAVVLMTPDDVARSRKGGMPSLRARQNVLFELGFFVAKLQRGRVCVIAKGGVEIPSNYWGVEYIPWDDSEGWKYKLLRELKAAKLAVSEG